jgi:hypothetical protein
LDLSTTSYADWRPAMGTPVRITLGMPRQPPPGRERWIYLAELAPRGWYFRQPDYARHYLAQLDRHANDIERKLGWLSDQFGPLVLCCFERRPKTRPITAEDCHRRHFAAWWQARTGQPVPEK